MATIFQKIRLVTLGSIHDLLDKAIDTNSPSAVRQYVRDMEAALAQLQNDAAVQAGACRTLKREIGDLQIQIDTKKATIQKILGGTAENRETIAKTMATEVIGLQKQQDQLKEDLATQQKNSAEVDAAVAKLSSRHTEYVTKLHSLERLDRDSKAKEAAAKAVSGAASVLNSGVSVDDLEQKMRTRNDVAQEKFERAMGSIPDPTADPTADAAAEDLLAQLRPTQKAGAAS